MAYFGHLDKRPVLESLKVEESASVILTVTNLVKKKIICQAVLDFYPQAKVIVKINSVEERKALQGLGISAFVHAEHETARLLVKKSIANTIEAEDTLATD